MRKKYRRIGKHRVEVITNEYRAAWGRTAPVMRAMAEATARMQALTEATPADPATTARALGELFSALAVALALDKHPTFVRRRAELVDVVSATALAFSKARSVVLAQESAHVLALLEDVREARHAAVDAFDATQKEEKPRFYKMGECYAYAVRWLGAHGWARAAAHLTEQRELTERVLGAQDDRQFNAAAVALMNAGGFAPMSLGALKVKLSRARGARGKSKRRAGVTAAS